MPKFEKRFVYFMWDDELQGKKCFVANSIGLLYEFVEINLKSYRYEIIGEGDGKAPFKINGPDNANMVFCYHDPWYDLKVAHEQGKTIQAHVSGNMWVNIAEPLWEDSSTCYRIMPEEQNPVTHRELALWLAQGNGEIYHYDDSGFKTEVKTSYGYHQEYENCDCNEYKTFHSKIRKWGETEWVTPTREYMGLEE